MTRADEAIGPVIGHMQTDTFCEGCGYNLHTQAVMRDPRLGIVVCRCPECGRFAPAGHGTTATRVWLNRAATLLLVIWVLFVMVLFSLCALFLGMIAYGHVMNNVTWTQVAEPAAGKTGKFIQTRYEYRIRTPQADDPFWAQRQRFEQGAMGAVAGGLGFLTGAFFTAILWHLRWPWRAVAWLPPLVGCAVAGLIWVSDSMAVRIWQWGLNWIMAYFVLECVAVAVGLALGRPIVRGILRLLLPPKPRQHLAFLWTVDGKRLTFSGGETRSPD